MNKPIIYTDLVDIRFADLDFYGHVNSREYIDIVSTSRLNFMANTLGTPIDEVSKKGIGFFLTKATVNYRRPINGLQKVLVNSHVAEVREEKVLVVEFQILKRDGSKAFSDGTFEFTVVDLKTNRATRAPEWIYPYFYEAGGDTSIPKS